MDTTNSISCLRCDFPPDPPPVDDYDDCASNPCYGDCTCEDHYGGYFCLCSDNTVPEVIAGRSRSLGKVVGRNSEYSDKIYIV